ncbi:cysteine desulfurase family protein [Thiocapsa rosea]|uniref:cysteine desulfurase n=1 Tax=Thiocapsa rosea TaxID=69360 RepID=A0A495VB29_9GAMM|nr:cysteine desulfurase family protein [Thiocapsa rosea]RKT46601.1 cysteine desulfurase IscS [Thiocapsa rosea]
MQPLYFDTAATTAVDPDVIEDMIDVLRNVPGNPSSTTHPQGRDAAQHVEAARATVAAELGCDTDEVIFTAGATEANNLALRGIALGYRAQGRHLVTSAIEHKAVLACCHGLESDGVETTYVKPSRGGWVTPESIVAALRPETLMVSLMQTNNETGVMQPIDEVALAVAEAGVLFHVDAAQGAGKFAIDLTRIPIDLLSLSAHKFYGPKGVGCLVVRDRRHVRLRPLMEGGRQEYGLRPGTLATHQIVGLSSALTRVAARREQDLRLLGGLKQRFLQRLGKDLRVHINGDPARTSPYILNISFEGVPSDALINQLADALAIGSGSACSSGAVEPSHVLRAMEVEEGTLYGAVRISFGRDHTETEIDQAAASVRQAIARIRAMGD